MIWWGLRLIIHLCEINLNSVYSKRIYTKDRRDKFHETWKIFLCCTEFYCTIQLINKIKRMHFFNFHCQHSYYAYYKNLLKRRRVVTSRKYFLLREAAGLSCCNIQYSGKVVRLVHCLPWTYNRQHRLQRQKLSLYSPNHYSTKPPHSPTVHCQKNAIQSSRPHKFS